MHAAAIRWVLVRDPSGQREPQAFLCTAYNLVAALKGETNEWPRREFFYFSDDGDLVAMRFNRWKAVFAEQRAEGFDVWQDPLILYAFQSFSIYGDPFEKADRESSY